MQDSVLVTSRLLMRKRLICLVKDGSSVEEPGSRQKTRSIEVSFQHASRDYLLE